MREETVSFRGLSFMFPDPVALQLASFMGWTGLDLGFIRSFF